MFAICFGVRAVYSFVWRLKAGFDVWREMIFIRIHGVLIVLIFFSFMFYPLCELFMCLYI